MSQLKVGAARVDITPKRPCHMSGYSGRIEKSVGVSGLLHARAIVFESDAGTAALAACDLAFVAPESIEAVRQAVCASLAMPPENLMVCATHTHSGPQSSYHQSPDSRVSTDVEWAAGLEAKLAEAILLAHAQRRPAKMGVVRGESKINCNRRETFEDGGIWLGHAWEKPVDREIAALRIDAADGTPLARIVHYGCHATALGPKNLRISGDWPGEAMLELEKQAGGGVVFAFVNGGAGNVNPIHKGLTDPDAPELRELAETFVRDAQSALAKPLELSGQIGPIRGAFATLALPRKQSGVEAGRGRFKRVRAQALRVGPAAFSGLPCEIVWEIVRAVKDGAPLKDTFPCSYVYNGLGARHPGADEVGGYLVAKAHFEEGGYEVFQTPFAPEAEQAAVDGLLALLRDVCK